MQYIFPSFIYLDVPMVDLYQDGGVEVFNFANLGFQRCHGDQV